MDLCLAILKKEDGGFFERSAEGMPGRWEEHVGVEGAGGGAHFAVELLPLGLLSDGGNVGEGVEQQHVIRVGRFIVWRSGIRQ